MTKHYKMLQAPATIEVSAEDLYNAAIIYENAYYSSASLLLAFELNRYARGATRGMTTDQEQDLLRAMLVMASAGLDSSLKQLIRDTLPVLTAYHPKVQLGVEKFIQRGLRGDDEEFGFDSRFLAKILAAPSIHNKILEEYIYALTGDSLQSADQLMKIVSLLGLDAKKVGIDRATLDPIFKIRNQIIHELDIDLSAAKRVRRMRALDDMCHYTDEILTAAYMIIKAVDKLLRV